MRDEHKVPRPGRDEVLILKGAGFSQLWQEMAALLVFGAIIFSFAVLRFQKRIS